MAKTPDRLDVLLATAKRGTDDELKELAKIIGEELERRRKPVPPPERPLQDWGQVLGTVRHGIAEAFENGYVDKSFKDYIYEAVLRAMYGDAIFAALAKLKG